MLETQNKFNTGNLKILFIKLVKKGKLIGKATILSTLTISKLQLEYKL